MDGIEWGNVVQHLPFDDFDPSEYGDKDGRDITLQRHDGDTRHEVLLLGIGSQFGGFELQFV